MKKIENPNHIQLRQIAENLIEQGLSVIPVHGDNYASQPKMPATQWKIFQKRTANQYELSSWFRENISAIGIVCGEISQLMVIDFDDHLTYHNFCKQFPMYGATYTVKTRRGYHLYYTIHQKIQTHHFSGGDIKGEKSYVIAPPSIIRGHVYTVINHHEQQILHPEDIDNIFNYLQIAKLDPQTSNHKFIARSTLDLKKLYDQLCPELGRNNALYRVASVAKTQKIKQADTESALIIYHINQPAPRNHRPENDQDRFLEAQRTIESAYHSSTIRRKTTHGLPNAIREYFLQAQESTILPRLLDIFMLAKWKSGQYFTMSDAISLGDFYGLNRKSVMQVLTGSLSTINGQHIIYRSNVEYPDNRGLNFCTRGRPTKIMFQVPSVRDLLSRFKIAWSPSDLITAKDVKSAHSYRLALHREYIKRLSPSVPMGWYADRIGVNVRTIQRYNRELEVQITQNLAHFTLSKQNLDSLPKRHSRITKNATNGFWLELEDGSRYPAWRHIGAQLLKSQKKPIAVCIQKPSKLILSDELLDVEEVVWHPIEPTEFIRLQAFRSCTEDRPTLTQVVDNLFSHVKKRLNHIRYIDLQLHFDSVINYIAKDKVAETISSYLYAYDDDGNRVMRPAKRGIAYRMLKEFGNGNVYLALLDIQTEMWYSLARHAMRFGYAPAAMKYLLSALD